MTAHSARGPNGFSLTKQHDTFTFFFVNFLRPNAHKKKDQKANDGGGVWWPKCWRHQVHQGTEEWKVEDTIVKEKTVEDSCGYLVCWQSGTKRRLWLRSPTGLQSRHPGWRRYWPSPSLWMVAASFRTLQPDRGQLQQHRLMWGSGQTIGTGQDIISMGYLCRLRFYLVKSRELAGLIC